MGLPVSKNSVASRLSKRFIPLDNDLLASDLNAGFVPVELFGFFGPSLLGGMIACVLLRDPLLYISLKKVRGEGKM